jgi:hypothetical protein
MAPHCHLAVIQGRGGKLKDKVKVENWVLEDKGDQKFLRYYG